MNLKDFIRKIYKSVCAFFSSREDFDHELFRAEFEESKEWTSLSRNPDKTYSDPEVEAAWKDFLKSKSDEILAIW